MQANQTNATETPAKLARIEAYLAQDAGNAELLATAIDLNLALGRIVTARKHADAALALYPNDHFFQHRSGSVYIAEGKLSEAEEVLTLLDKELTDPGIAYNLAYVYYLQRRNAEAHKKLLPYVDRPEATPELVMLFLRTLHHMGEVKQALEVVERQMEKYGTRADFLGLASLLYLDDGQMTQAENLSAAALRTGAAPIEALIASGTVSLGLGKIDVAKGCFKQALDINPSEGRGWSGLGLASLLSRDLATATVELQRAVETLPTHIGTWHSLAWCQLMNRDLSGAKASFNKALALDRNLGETHGGLAVIAAFEGDRACAEESINRALKLDAQGLSARYAQMVLSGNIKDPVKFQNMAMQLLAARQGPFGKNLAEIIEKNFKPS